jgi:hypothetical protein
METTLTITLEGKTKKLLGIYKATHDLGSMEEAINQLVQGQEQMILKEAGK